VYFIVFSAITHASSHFVEQRVILSAPDTAILALTPLKYCSVAIIFIFVPRGDRELERDFIPYTPCETMGEIKFTAA